MTTLVLSPHLDDALLSIPALIGSRVLRGERVVVLTVFSEGDARHVARREEDRRAVSLLGAEAVHAGLLDAPFRRGLAEDFRSLVSTELRPGDDDAARVAEVLARCVRDVAPDDVLVPLGVGEHIDHRVVHEAHSRFAARVAFYEDRPYALVRHAARMRLARIGAAVDGGRAALAHAAVEEHVASAMVAPYVQAFLPEAERAARLAELAAIDVPRARATALRLRSESIVLDDAAIDRGARAVRAYVSQLPSLYGSAEAATELTFGERPYRERLYWRL